MSENHVVDRTPIILTLVFMLVLLLLILFYLYKRLNRDTNDQYSIQQLIFKEGGLRDRVTQGLDVVEGWIRSLLHHDEQENVGNTEEGNNNADGDNDVDDVAEELDGSENKQEEQKDPKDEDSSDDYSSIDLKERLVQNTEEDKVVKEEESNNLEIKDVSKENDAIDEERVGLFVDIKTLSGSAIWSDEKLEESDVTAL